MLTSPDYSGFHHVAQLFYSLFDDDLTSMGPILRWDIPRDGIRASMRKGTPLTLQRLRVNRWNNLIVIVIDEQWDSQARDTIEDVEQTFCNLARQWGMRLWDVVAVTSCGNGTEWLSLTSGSRGLVEDSDITVDSLGRLWSGAFVEESRDVVLRDISSCLAATKPREQWKHHEGHHQGAGALPQYPSWAQLRMHLCSQPTADWDDEAAQLLRTFFISLLDTYQGPDGVVALVVDADAELWVAWMWSLLPTLDFSIRPDVVLAIALWHYINGDACRAQLLVDQALDIFGQRRDLSVLRRLMTLCITPQQLRRSVESTAQQVGHCTPLSLPALNNDGRDSRE